MKTLKIVLSMLVLFLLTACGGGGGSSTAAQGSVSGTVTKGPVTNATVMAYALVNGQMGTQIGTAPTDLNGNFSVNTGSYAGPVLLQMSGGTYTDEATGNLMSMAPGDVMTAVMPTTAAGTAISGIQVTPITSMAQTMAQHFIGGMTDANIATANAAMGNYFTISDILHTQPMNPLITGSGTGASVSAQNYGMALAAISQLAQTQGMTTSSAMVTALMNDASDGVMDGKASGVVLQMGGMVGGVALPTNAGTSGLSSAMNTFMFSPQNKSGVTTATLMNKLNGATGQMLGSSPPTMMNAMVSGTVFNGQVSKATVKAYAVNGGTVGAQIASVATDSLGNFSLPLGSYTGAVMLQMSGGTYTDEATNTTMTMAASDVMTAVMPTVASGANVTGIWITPVTSMAQTRALALTGGMTDANINAANNALGNYFSVTASILTTQPMNPLVAGSGTGASSDTSNYGISIAAMSQYAKTLGIVISSNLVTAMMNDASDGVMNGKMGATQITMPMSGMMGGMGSMAATAGTSGLATAMSVYLTPGTTNASGLTTTTMATLINKLTNSSGQI